MSEHFPSAVAALLVMALCSVTAVHATDRYDVVVEYDGPHFHVVNAPAIDQLVDDPVQEYAFQDVYGVAVSLETGGRIMNYVLDSGNNRVLGFETQIDAARLASSAATWTDPRTAATEWDDEGINLTEWAGASTNWVIPYSETFRVNGVLWEYVADLTGYGAEDQVYTIEFDDATNAPELNVPTGALGQTDSWEVFYCVTNYQGGGTAAFGLGDIDQGNSDGVSVAEILIDETVPAVKSFQDLRSIATIANQTTSTTDEVWVIDAADNSADQDQELMVYTITQGGGVEAFLEAYDDSLALPRDVHVVAKSPDTYTDPTYTAAGSIAHFDAIAIVDANQVTGHTFSIDMTGDNVTITDLTTGRDLVNGGAKTDFVTAGTTCYVIPGLGVDFNTGVASGTDATFVTERAIPSRYAFVSDTGSDRIKVVSVPDIGSTTGDDLPGDAHTCVTQPSGVGTLGATADQDYYFTTPATVPGNWKNGTATRPVEEASLDSLIADPDGASVTWNRVADLSTAAPTDKVYELDWWEGVILFGDGLHGEIPPASTDFKAVYSTTPDVLRYGSSGTETGEFDDPEAVCAIWNAGLGCFVVYVADTDNDRVQKLLFYPEDAGLGTPPRMEYVCSWTAATSGTDTLAAPAEIDVETNGTDYFVAVADASDRVIIYDDVYFGTPGDTTAPAFEVALGGTGTELGLFGDIEGVDLLRNGSELEIYVADGSRNVVTKYVKAPEPTVTLSFTGASALPNSFPPAGRYVVTFVVTNTPTGSYVDFYYSTSGTWGEGSEELCFTSESIGTDDSPVTWTFSESPGGTPADGSYYLHARLFDSGDNLLGSDAAIATELLTIDSNLNAALKVNDHLDNDPTLLLAPGEEQTVSLELSYPDSTIGCSFIGTFPASIVQIEAIDVSGEAWLGTGYETHVSYATYDNALGTFAVMSAVTGAPTGLSGAGDFEIAKIKVSANDALDDDTRFLSGSFALDVNESGIRDIHGADLGGWGARDMTVKLAYVGDIGSSSNPSFTDSVPPYQQPDPDGYMNFADQMGLTMGWNGGQVGDAFLRDPIADMGPVTGNEPKLVPTRDGHYNVDDLMAFTRNWSYFGARSWVTAPAMHGMSAGAGFTPLRDRARRTGKADGSRDGAREGETLGAGATSLSLDVVSGAMMPNQLVTLDVRVDQAVLLTGTMVRVTYDPRELDLVTAEKGEMLARDGANILFNTIRREGVCELCLSRLKPSDPGVSGDGVVARLVFHVESMPRGDLTYVYDLRDWQGVALARGSCRLPLTGNGRPEQLVLGQNYPNPIRPQTSIVFALPTREVVDLAVFDLNGRRVKTLMGGMQEAGTHTIEWDSRDQAGVLVPSGVYFCKMCVGGEVRTRKMSVAR
ncbi:FlgD immunoglobulin-like domain containing protein [Candidatus Eisenbacteria bacterium]|uniref:FlgD immunoglobulin-like domain containing protein n=1 Tax=Eiseniibacteriota bacterium TaxID=2212470 RepID=A0ABV6YII0_UNCEI